LGLEHDRQHGGQAMPINELTELDQNECLRLLEHHHFGRLAFPDHVGALPMILPVNYMFKEGVVVRTSEGSKLRAAGDNAGAAFEIDGVDDRERTGWSVVVRGRVEEVTDAAELAELSATPLITWAPGDKSYYIRVRPSRITGRRISIAHLPSTWWG